ncbi:hypothetical protein HK096_010359 [Nowakowskiella sp. JEL0078]|nr:hypothetical protein HK096_010359 [Nowakowskiella sp. JEL0078]
MSSRLRPKRKVQAKPDFHSSSDDGLTEEDEAPPLKVLKTASSRSVSWTSTPSLIVATHNSPTPSALIAAFDLDDTLTTSKRGSSAWDLAFPLHLSKIAALFADGFRIVILSNQGGLGSHYAKSRADIVKQQEKTEHLKSRVEGLFGHLERAGVKDVTFIASLEYDWNRKPAIGMWRHIVDTLNGGVEVNLEKCLFVGDAGGRVYGVGSKKKKDFSDSDRKFALNLGIKFMTPEKFFLGAEVSGAIFRDSIFNPNIAITEASKNIVADVKRVDDKPEIVVFVGRPGSGKSTFAKKHFTPLGYDYVNQDTLKTKEKCIKACEASVANKKSVVIDNTNADKGVRSNYIAVAKKHNIPIRCFLFATPLDICKHNDGFRSAMDGWMDVKKEEKRSRVGTMVFGMWDKKFEKPTVSEGFEEVREIVFVPEFETKEMREKWSLFYV